MITNFNADACELCKTADLLSRYHFQKIYPDQPKAHCYGTCLYLIQYLLSHQESMSRSCFEILSEVKDQTDFEKKAHFFSANEHAYYKAEGSLGPLDLDRLQMKRYFKVLIDREPSSYLVASLLDPKVGFKKAHVYAALLKFPNQLMMLGYENEKGNNHCIVLSTVDQKLLAFDPSAGLYQFSDSKTMSYVLESYLKESRFRWIVGFDFNPPCNT